MKRIQMKRKKERKRTNIRRNNTGGRKLKEHQLLSPNREKLLI